MPDEYLTDEQVAELSGTMKPTSVATWAKRHGVERRMMMPADEVKEALANAPGAGARRDLYPDARVRSKQ